MVAAIERQVQKMFTKIFSASWRTSLLGILSGSAMLLTQAVNVLDGDPNTKFSWQACLAALALMGFGVAARDNKVNSKAAGAE